jgi:hypothetical protein
MGDGGAWPESFARVLPSRSQHIREFLNHAWAACSRSTNTDNGQTLRTSLFSCWWSVLLDDDLDLAHRDCRRAGNCSGIVPLWPRPAHSTVQYDVAVTVYRPWRVQV